MQKKECQERTLLEDWSCKDVDQVYEKINKVGSGTYGEVNKARLRSDPTKFVALKKIKDETETEGFPITALREIKLLQQCDHPNVVRLLDVVLSGKPEPKKKRSSTYLVFEYMEHELLGLIETFQMSVAQVKCIMKQILEGLKYLHDKNIIHRDIKSANILINNNGEVKIADFGLAKKVAPNFSGKLTQRVVTRWYRAPELLLGLKKYTSKIDMWAVGCVFAELLLGKTAALFPAQKTPEQFQYICEKCGNPNDQDWPKAKELPNYISMVPKKKTQRTILQYMKKQKPSIDQASLDLLERLLQLNPDNRISAEDALNHQYFSTYPYACSIEEMPRISKECHAFLLNSEKKAHQQQQQQQLQQQQQQQQQIQQQQQTQQQQVQQVQPQQIPTKSTTMAKSSSNLNQSSTKITKQNSQPNLTYINNQQPKQQQPLVINPSSIQMPLSMSSQPTFFEPPPNNCYFPDTQNNFNNNNMFIPNNLYPPSNSMYPPTQPQNYFPNNSQSYMTTPYPQNNINYNLINPSIIQNFQFSNFDPYYSSYLALQAQQQRFDMKFPLLQNTTSLLPYLNSNTAGWDSFQPQQYQEAFEEDFYNQPLGYGKRKAASELDGFNELIKKKSIPENVLPNL